MAPKSMTKTSVEESALARPSFLPQNDKRGTENIQRQDMQLPRILVAQGLSPQLQPNEAKYIQGLVIGDMFNDLTNDIYGRGPIEVTIIRADAPRAVEFFPREDGGGIKDPNVPLNDPRLKWRADGKKPVATKFHDYVLLTLPLSDSHNPFDNLIIMSLKGTGIRVAKQLNALLAMRNAPSFSAKFTLTSTIVKNNKGSFALFNFKNAGWVDEDTFNAGVLIYESIHDKKIDTQDTPPEDEELGTDL